MNGYKGGLEVSVNIPLKLPVNKFKISYDAADPFKPLLPPIKVIEAKTRHYWTLSPDDNQPAVLSLAAQLYLQKWVTQYCKLKYEVYVDNRWGAEGISEIFPDITVEHIPFGYGR